MCTQSITKTFDTTHHRLRHFEAVVSSTACFAAQHRQLYRKPHLGKYDVQFRKFVRCIVGPSTGHKLVSTVGMIYCMVGICVWITGPTHTTHTHTIPVRVKATVREGHGKTTTTKTSAFQAPLYKSLLMRAPCLRFGRLKP